MGTDCTGNLLDGMLEEVLSSVVDDDMWNYDDWDWNYDDSTDYNSTGDDFNVPC